MDAASFENLVARVQATHRGKDSLSFSAAADRVAATLTAFPDGVTEAVLLSNQPTSTTAATFSSALAEIKQTRRVDPRSILRLAVNENQTYDGRFLEMREDHSSTSKSRASVLLAPDQKLSTLRGSALLGAGRRLLMTRCAIAECSSVAGGGSLLILPTKRVVLVLEAERDAQLVAHARQHCRLRGQPPPDPASVAPPIALRVVDCTAPEWHHGRCLRRLLLEMDAEDAALAHGSPPGEIEAELLLWDEDQSLIELLPPCAERPMLVIKQPTFLTSGCALAGGAPAQLGIDVDATFLCLVDETSMSNGGRKDGERHPQQAAVSKAQGRDMVLGWLVSPPSAAPDGGACLFVRNGSSSDVTVELAGDAISISEICDSLRPGHHLMITGLAPRASEPLAPWPNGQPPVLQQPPSTRMFGTLDSSGGTMGGGAARWNAAVSRSGGIEQARAPLRASVTNLSMMRAALSSPPPVGIPRTPLAEAGRFQSIVSVARAVSCAVVPPSATSLPLHPPSPIAQAAEVDGVVGLLRLTLADADASPVPHCAVLCAVSRRALADLVDFDLSSLEARLWEEQQATAGAVPGGGGESGAAEDRSFEMASRVAESLCGVVSAALQGGRAGGAERSWALTKEPSGLWRANSVL